MNPAYVYHDWSNATQEVSGNSAHVRMHELAQVVGHYPSAAAVSMRAALAAFRRDPVNGTSFYMACKHYGVPIVPRVSFNTTYREDQTTSAWAYDVEHAALFREAAQPDHVVFRSTWTDEAGNERHLDDIAFDHTKVEPADYCRMVLRWLREVGTQWVFLDFATGDSPEQWAAVGEPYRTPPGREDWERECIDIFRAHGIRVVLNGNPRHRFFRGASAHFVEKAGTVFGELPFDLATHGDWSVAEAQGGEFWIDTHQNFDEAVEQAKALHATGYLGTRLCIRHTDVDKAVEMFRNEEADQ